MRGSRTTIGTCETCFWWCRQGAALAAAVRNPAASAETGTCHLFAPTVVRNALEAVAFYPVTHQSRFCGEYEPIDGGDGGPDPDDGERAPDIDGVVVPIGRRVA